jgi:hypothetical protein
LGEPIVSLPTGPEEEGYRSDQEPWRERVASARSRAVVDGTQTREQAKGIGARAKRAKRAEKGEWAVLAEHSTEGRRAGEVAPTGKVGNCGPRDPL